ANANSDTVSIVDTRRDTAIETVPCRPEGRLPFGSGCNAVTFGPNAAFFVANGTNNCVAVVVRGGNTGGVIEARDCQVRGLIPTGWYPGAILLSPDGK